MKKRLSDRLCGCGCGKFTYIAPRGYRKGKASDFLPSHAWKAANKASFKHGYGMESAAYRSWAYMRQRCLNRNHHAYNNYGGRGITLCERWNKFENFLADMGERPEGDMTLERIDSNGNYCPENCRWAPRSDQPKNTRTNLKITFRGETKHLAEWARTLNMNPSTLRDRIQKNGWSVERALTTPTFNRGQG